MDAIRKQLDVLMGANRNGDVAEVNRKYYDRDVCRLFLAGLCPHDLFQLTKMDMGPCPKIHSLQLRKEYEEAKAKGDHNFDRELEDMIERLIVECERKIQRALKRLEDEDAKAAIAISVSKVTQTPEVIELSKQIKEKLKEADVFDFEGKTDSKIRVLEVVEELKAQRADKQSVLLLDAFNKDRASLPQPIQNPSPLATLPVLNPPDPHTQEMINEKLKKAEDLGEMGMIDEAQKALEEAEALKKLGARQEPVLESSKYSAADVRITDQKLRVCDICGAFLSVYDNDRRLADHFGGKLHLGYMQIREKLAELQEERNKKRKIDRPEDDRRSKERSRDRDGAGSRDRDIDREVRGDNRDRGREHDRRNRDHDRHHDRDHRDRDRDTDRSRNYDSRSRRRSRSRSRDRGRDYDRHRPLYELLLRLSPYESSCRRDGRRFGDSAASKFVSNRWLETRREFADLTYLSDLFFRELEEKFERLFSDVGRPVPSTFTDSYQEGLVLLLRCCMVMLHFLEFDLSLVVEKCKIILSILRRLCVPNLPFALCSCKLHPEADNIISGVTSLAPYQCPNDLIGINGPNEEARTPMLSFFRRILEVFIDEFLRNCQMRKHFTMTDNVSIAEQQLFRPKDNRGLNEELMNSHILAFELSVNVYVGHISRIGLVSNINGEHVQPCYHDKKLSFDSCIQPMTCHKLQHQMDSLFEFCCLNSQDFLSETKGDIANKSFAFIKENSHILDDIFRDEACLILQYIVINILSEENVEDTKHENENKISQEMYCFAAVLKLMSSSLLQIIWNLRQKGCVGGSEALGSKVVCREYNFIVGIISCFGKYELNRLIKRILLDVIGSNSAKQGNLDVLMPLVVLSKVTIRQSSQEKQIKASTCRSSVVASNLHHIQMLYLRKNHTTEIHEDQSTKCLTSIEDARRCNSYISGANTCNGETFIQSLPGNQKDPSEWADLVDFIEGTHGKDYSDWLRHRKRFRVWQHEKRLVMKGHKKVVAARRLRSKKAKPGSLPEARHS
ncbi:RNA-binding protein Luc7-like [Musa troglodytarum]|uniref:RNA-binding protein Luc7-like n=1 Tax=Musa troglodytarum TaxID=320322 RepID=A0A9E7GM98_9LILI|nr:RNA-binding protein Luc7-like [Musa troglodytarum]